MNHNKVYNHLIGQSLVCANRELPLHSLVLRVREEG